MRISKHCYAVTGFGFTPPWEVNAGFIVGDAKTLVVDTGPSYLAARTVYGYARSAGPNNEMFAVNTEMHTDHLMGNSFFQEMAVPLWGHEKCSRTADTLQSIVAEYNETIPDSLRKEKNESSVFFWNSRIVNPQHRISKKTRFDLGNAEAVVFPVSGHTPANMLVNVPRDSVLFTGDIVVADYMPNLESGGQAEWTQWLSALQLVRELEPSIVVPGHGRVLEGSEIDKEVKRVEQVIRAKVEK